MNHPFELDLSDLKAMDLDFEEQLSDRETAQIGGGKHSEIVCISAPCPGSETGGKERKPPWYRKPVRKPPFTKPPVATTLAIGEEGGGYEVTTLAIGEEGGDRPEILT